jgi:FMN-dependent oxidoreductase (nitrilotriacetate monooxygenase family)
MSGRSAARTMHLALFINPTGHHQASWRHPRADPDAGINFAHYRDLARIAERARFDALFLADNQAVRLGPPATVSRVAQYVANFEPLTLLSALAAVTRRIGLIATASTSYNYPYQVARKFASIDHISAGRAGWNIVTSGMAQEAFNFGRDEHYEHELRYERAAEFVEVCKSLWDSWEDDAFPRNAASGTFSDPEKLHVWAHEGAHFRVRGPLNIPRPPQGYPVLVQAGSSSTGIDFASRVAEMIFVTPLTLAEAQAGYREIKRRVAEHGRDPEHVKVMPGLAVIAGATGADADADYELLQSLLHVDVALNILSMKMNHVDLTGQPLDAPLDESLLPSGASTYFRQWAEIGRNEGLTLRQLALRASASLAGLAVRGSGEHIADVMEEWFRSEAADGFNIQPAYLPGGLHDFVTHVIPVLRRRGLVRREYRGRTLRDHFGLPRPAWRSWPTGQRDVGES